MNNILELICVNTPDDSADEPTTSSSSEGSECQSDHPTPTLEHMHFLTQLLANGSRLPIKRKGRSLAETVEILKKQKQAEVAEEAREDSPTIDVETPSPTPPAVPFNLPVFGPNGQAAAERLASMVVKEREQQLAAVVSSEKEKEVKNKIKQLTNKITADQPPSLDDDKRFSCQICNKKFANKFLLNKHIFIHTGLRPHQCPDCHKSFNRKDNLLRHRKTHILALREETKAIGRITRSEVSECPVLTVSPMLLATVVPSRTDLPTTATPESLLLTLFAAHQQQQQHV